MFEFPAFLPPTNLGLPMHSPSALTEHVSPNLARFFWLDLAVNINATYLTVLGFQEAIIPWYVCLYLTLSLMLRPTVHSA